MEHKRTYLGKILYAILSLNLALLLWQSVTFYLLYQRGLLVTNSRSGPARSMVTPSNLPIQLCDVLTGVPPLPQGQGLCAVGR